MAKAPFTWNALPVGSNSLPSSNFICESATLQKRCEQNKPPVLENAQLSTTRTTYECTTGILRGPGRELFVLQVKGHRCKHELTANLQTHSSNPEPSPSPTPRAPTKPGQELHDRGNTACAHNAVLPGQLPRPDGRGGHASQNAKGWYLESSSLHGHMS